MSTWTHNDVTADADDNHIRRYHNFMNCVPDKSSVIPYFPSNIKIWQ